MKECICSRYKENRILTTFKVSDTKTYLLCVHCGGIFAEWTDRIFPPIMDFDSKEKEDMI